MPGVARAGDDVNDEFSASDDIDLKQIKDNPAEISTDDAHESDTIKYCTKGEPVSCYCSASHTDNISTDEHDSLRDSHASSQQQTTPKTLQLSDSGADLTADVGCGNSAWQKYWAVNGERLIWESWITKYSAYINPEYLQVNPEGSYPKDLSSEDLLQQDKAEGSGSLKFSFDSLSPPHQDSSDYSTALGLSISLLQVKENSDPKPPPPPPNEIVEKNRMLVRNLSYSDSYEKLNREIEGWNPLSPVSNDCETEAERLLSSRCASRTGSSARTVDSMTNVTRLTASSFDFSESSKNSDSFSSVSSIQSSLTSTSSEEADEPGEYDHQWNVLWTKHYEHEYLDHYKKFLLETIGETTESADEAAESVINDCVVEDNFKVIEATNLDEETSESSNKDVRPETPKSRRRRVRHRRAERKVIDSVGYLLKNLIKIEETPVQEETTPSCKCDMDIDLPINSPKLDDTNQSEIEDKLKCKMEMESPVNSPLGESEIVDLQRKSEMEKEYLSLNASKIEEAVDEDNKDSHNCKSLVEKQQERSDVECERLMDEPRMEEIKNKTNTSRSEVEVDSVCLNPCNTAGSKTVQQQKSADMECDLVVNLSEIENPLEEINNSNISVNPANENDEEVEKETNVMVEYINSKEEETAMSAMGVPLSFGCKEQTIKKSGSSSLIKKRSFEESDLDQSSSNRIQAAFNLLGIEMNTSKEKKFKGSIEYKMKHIRSQNRRLQFSKEEKNQSLAPKPKHIHFDDDGEAISDFSVSNEVTVQNSHQDELSGIISSSENELEMVPDEEEKQEVERCEENVSKKRKRKRKINVPIEIRENPNLKKFWRRRYSLFSKFDQGIKLDEESWFSVTPEMVAEHTAKRCQCDIIIDAFCGAGGNSIQFAFTCKKVIAIDIDTKKIELARHNAQVYGVADRIEFIVGDFFQLASSLQADTVFLSPPWGGPQYKTLSSYDLQQLQPAPFSELLSTARKITPNVVLFLPKNSNTYPLVTAAGPGGKMEIEQNFLGKRLIAITAYYGNVVKEVPLQKNSKEVN